MNEYERAILNGPNGEAELRRLRMQDAITNNQQPTPGLQSVLDQLQLAKPPPTMIEAFGVVIEALQPLHDEARLRVLHAAAVLLGINLGEPCSRG